MRTRTSLVPQVNRQYEAAEKRLEELKGKVNHQVGGLRLTLSVTMSVTMRVTMRVTMSVTMRVIIRVTMSVIRFRRVELSRVAAAVPRRAVHGQAGEGGE